MIPRGAALLLGAVTLALTVGCGSAELDAGFDRPDDPLPVDAHNPLIISNDGARDNWQGELAAALASSGQLQLLGIVVNASAIYPSLSDNLSAWNALVNAARASGMGDIPDPLASDSAPLTRPSSGAIDDTTPTTSAGAAFIIDASAHFSQPLLPVVVATGGRLTDLADAYLLDHSVTARVTVVASAGQTTGASISTGWPNGDLDPWATEIVVSKFRYVQVNAYYEQKDDVSSARIAELPQNAFSSWMNSKLNDILALQEAPDQISVAASAFASFPLSVLRASSADATDTPAGTPPTLVAGQSGNFWAITRGDTASSTARFWDALLDPQTFGH